MRSADRPVLVCIFLLVLLWPAFAEAAMAFAQEPPQTVILEKYGGEGGYTDGYDFSERAAQRWLESGPDNPSLNSDFYLNEFGSGIFGPSVHPYLLAQGWVRMINYGQVSLDAVSAVPSQSDSGFVEQGFVVGYTYGLFTKEGNYVALHVNSQYPYNQIAYGDWYKNGIEFSWRFVSGGEPPPTGVLSVEIFSDKTSYLGETPQISGIVTLDGKPVYGVSVCVGAYSHTGQALWGICYTTDSNGQFFGSLELPRDYYGAVKVTASVQHSGKSASKDIWITILQPQMLPLYVELGFVRDRNVVWAVPGKHIYLESVGRVTSNAVPISDATVQLELMDQTFGTATDADGRFYYSFETANWNSGVYTLKATASKEGYSTTSKDAQFTVIGRDANLKIEITANQKYAAYSVARVDIRVVLNGRPLPFQELRVNVTRPSGRAESVVGQADENGKWYLELTVDEEGVFTVSACTDPFAFFCQQKTFVGEKGTQPPPPPAKECSLAIADVSYAKRVKLGESIQVMGRVVRIEAGESSPAANWKVELDKFNAIPRGGKWTTTTDANGRFSFLITSSDVGSFAVTLRPANIEDAGTRSCSTTAYYDRVDVYALVNVEVTLEKDVYTSGERVNGTVAISAKGLKDLSSDDLWRFFIAIAPDISVTGPRGAGELTYQVPRFDPARYLADQKRFDDTGWFWAPLKLGEIAFSWRTPLLAEEGKYEVRVQVTADWIETGEDADNFYLDKTIPAYLDISQEPPRDKWSAGNITGTYTDVNRAPIPDARVVVVAKWEKVSLRLSTTTDQNGKFSMSVERLNLLPGVSLQESLKKRYWVIVANATKEGYSTGADVISLTTPTIEYVIEIVSVDPQTYELNRMASNGQINFLDGITFTVKLKVRYTALTDVKLNLTTRSSGWAPIERKLETTPDGKVDGTKTTWNYDVTITSSSGKLEFKPWKDFNFYDVLHGKGAPPLAQITLEYGISKEIELVITGKLYRFPFFFVAGDDPNSQVYSSDPIKENPTVPWKGVRGMLIGLSCCSDRETSYQQEWGATSKSASKYQESQRTLPWQVKVEYPLTERPNIMVGFGQAWVGRGERTIQETIDGREIKFEKASGIIWARIFAGGAPFRNQPLKLEIIDFDPVSGNETLATGISAPQSVVTDKEGWIAIPLTLKEPDKEVAGSFKARLTSSILEGHADIEIGVRNIPSITFKIRAIHIIQVVDLPANNFVLIGNKPAAVRVYIEVTGDVDKAARKPEDEIKVLCEFTTGGTERTEVLRPMSRTLGWEVWFASQETPNLPPNTHLVPVDFPFERVLKPGDVGHNLQITVTVDPDSKISKPESVTIAGTVNRSKTIHLIFVPINMPRDRDFENFVDRQVKFLIDTYPVEKNRVVYERGEPYLNSDMNKATIVSELWKKYGPKTPLSGDVEFRVVGVLPDRWWYWNKGEDGVSYEHQPNVVLVKYGTPDDYVAAHELGHTFKLYKMTKNLQFTIWALEIVSGSLVDTEKVYGKEQYDIFDPPGLEVHGHILKGKDVYFIPESPDKEPNWNRFVYEETAGGKEIKRFRYNHWREAFFPSKAAVLSKQSNIYDVMGCARVPSQNTWMHISTYIVLLDQLKDPPEQSVLVISGTVFENGTALMDSPMPGWGVPYENGNQGDYQLQLVTSSGEVRYSLRFGEAGELTPFAFTVPFKTGTAKVVLMDRNGNVINEAKRSAHSPLVQLSPLNEMQRNMIDIRWTTEDADGDPLTYSLLYSWNGQLWTTIAAGILETRFQLDASALPGGENCTIMIIASDGFNAGYAVSKPFSVESKPPRVTILTQVTSYQEGEIIYLEGMAYDLEDGFLDSGSLRWYSSRDEFLGNGTGLEVTLSPGEHEVTLEVVDSSGATEKDTIVVTVEAAEKGWKIDQTLAIAGIATACVIILGVILLYRRRKPRRPAEKPAPRPPSATPTGLAAKSEAVKYCMSCGVPIDADAKYCEKCGASQMQSQKQTSTSSMKT
jgi:hypothetical protein